MSGISEIKKKAKMSIDEMYEVPEKFEKPEKAEKTERAEKSEGLEELGNTLIELLGNMDMNNSKDSQLGQLDNQKENKTETQLTGKHENRTAGKLGNQAGKLENQTSGKSEIQPNGKPEFQDETALQAILQTIQTLQTPQPIAQEPMFSPPKKVSTYKMTFNLSEQMYKAFNDLYAHRLLQGRKTEKSDMICEAIKLLIEMENNEAK